MATLGLENARNLEQSFASSLTSGVASNSIMSDRSCHVTVANGTRSTNLTMVEYKDVHGDWVGRPKALITPGQTDDGIHLKDNFLAPGAEGWVKYRVGNSDSMIIVHFRCPFGGGDDEAYWEPSTLQGFKLGAAKNSSNPLYATFEVQDA